MTTTANTRVAPEIVAAAREIIRSHGHAEVVGIHTLLDELNELFPTTPDMLRLLDLILTLWADLHIDQVPDMKLIEFA